jgi:hypothetical protein
MVYLANKFERPGFSQSPRFAMSEKLKERTQYSHSRKQKITRIRDTANSHMWAQHLLSRNQGEGKRVEWPCRADLIRNRNTSQTQEPLLQIQ